MIVLPRNFIQIRERAPNFTVHIIHFKTPSAARDAFKNAKKFWVDNNYAAFLVEGENVAVGVSSDIIASVCFRTNYIEGDFPVLGMKTDQKNAEEFLVKKSNKGKRRALSGK